VPLTVTMKKMHWQGLDWLVEGMRIDEDVLNRVTGTELRTLKEVYKASVLKSLLSGSRSLWGWS